MYSYYYQLNVSSDLTLPELTPQVSLSKDKADVHIYKGSVSKNGLENGEVLGAFLQAKEQQLWLSVPNIARFLIRHLS